MARRGKGRRFRLLHRPKEAVAARPEETFTDAEKDIALSPCNPSLPALFRIRCAAHAVPAETRSGLPRRPPEDGIEERAQPSSHSVRSSSGCLRIITLRFGKGALLAVQGDCFRNEVRER
jgi:hypothetical protein